MYQIIGGDQKEYGPVSAEELRRWITEGRLNAQSRVKAEGDAEWRLLSTFPEFADLLAAAPGTPPPLSAPSQGLSEEIFARDYDLDIGTCVGNAWELLKGNFGIVFGGVAIFLLIEFGISALAQIPFLGIIFSIGSIIITGPLMGGVYYFMLKNIRRQPTEIGDIFAGFRMSFGQLLLGYIVLVLLVSVAALPGMIITAVPIFVMVDHNAAQVALVLVAAMGLILAIIPAIYLSVCWLFTLPLIIDRQMEFWPAMKASRRMVSKHWWLVFGLTIVCSLVKLVGFVACCVGLFFTLPVAFGATMYAYESLFSPPASRAP